MKTKRHTYKKGWGRAVSALLAFALAAGLVLAAPPLDGLALATEATTQGGTTPEGSTPVDPPEEPGVSNPADTALDLTKPCSLTLRFPKPGETVMGGAQVESPDAGILVVDVYKIADAVRLPGYQTYQFSINPADTALYKAVDGLLTDELKSEGWHKAEGADDGALTFYYAPDPDKESTHGWSEFVDTLARVCLLKSNGIKPEKEAQPFASKITGLEPGLYLTVVHGTIPENALFEDDGDQYKETTDRVASLGYPAYIAARRLTGANGRFERYNEGTIRTNLAGAAYDTQNVYFFQPQLVSLPGYTVQATETVPSPVPHNTAEAGFWQHDVEMVTKHESKPRYIDLQIVKQLPEYLAGEDSVTFAYEIEYTDENGTPQKRYEFLSFNGPSEKGKPTRVIVDRIPITSNVTVTEMYTGYTYQFAGVAARAELNLTNDNVNYKAISLVTPNTQSITISANDLQAGSIQLTVPDAPGQAAYPADQTVRLDDGVTQIVTFRNTLAEINKGGGSVVNSFSGTTGSWTWTKRAFNRTNNQWEEVTDPNWKQPVDTVTAGGN